MKKVSGIVLFLALLFSCNNANEVPEIKTTPDQQEMSKARFDKDFHDFGSIVQGEVVAHAFKVYNIGTSDLLFYDAIPDCGCTKLAYEQKPIAPGDSAWVEIAFDSRGWSGSQYKQVTFLANTKRNKYTLTIKANVITKY